MASTALSTRLVHTWFSSPPCAQIFGSPSAYSRSTTTPFLSLWARMVSVLSSPSRTSTSRVAVLSMCEYSFIARPSSEIRPVLCPTSSASVARFGVESRHNQRRRELKGILDAVILQPGGQFAFPVALLQRVEEDGCAGALR